MSGDKSLTLLTAAGTRWEARQGFIMKSHYPTEKRSGGGVALAPGSPSHGSSRGGGGKGPGILVDHVVSGCFFLASKWAHKLATGRAPWHC